MSGYDVVVVGGRVAGASTALLLARAGARVALARAVAVRRDTLSTHGLMRAGVLQLSRWGLLDRVVAAGTPPIRTHDLPLRRRRSRCRSRSGRAPASTRCTPRAGTVLDRILVDAAAEAGADVLHGTRVTGAAPRPHRAAWRACARRTGRGSRATCRAGSWWAPTGSPRASPGRSRRRCCGQGRWAQRRALRLLPRTSAPPATSGPTATVSAAGLIPTNDGLSCVFVGDVTRRGCARCAWGGRPTTAFETLFGLAAPRTRGPAGVRQPGRAGIRGWAREARVRPPVVGPGLGPGRRRRPLQGPDQHARDHRRAARRGAAGRRRPRRPRRAPARAGRARRLPAPARRAVRRSCSRSATRSPPTTGTARRAAAAAPGQRGDDRRGRDAGVAAPATTGAPRPGRAVTWSLSERTAPVEAAAWTSPSRCSGASRSCPGARQVPPEAWSRRGAAVPGQAAGGGRGPPDAPRAGHGRAVAGPAGRVRDAPAAQGRALRAARPRRRAPPAWSLRNDLVLLLPDADVRSTPSSSGGAPRRRWPSGSAAEAERALAPLRRARSCPTTSTSPGPPPWRETLARAAPGPAAAGRPLGGPRPRRTPPTRRPTWRWPASTPSGATYAPRCASSSGWSRRCGASSARRPAAAAAQLRGRALRRGRAAGAASAPGEAIAAGRAPRRRRTRSATGWTVPTPGTAAPCR